MRSTRWWLGAVLALACVLGVTGSGRAQDEASAWQTPVNVSQSGTAAAAQLVTGSDGTVIALWRETGAGFAASRQVDGQWTAAQPVNGPFGPDALQQRDAATALRLAVAGAETLHAVWLDGEQVLWHSAAPAAAWADGTAAWADGTAWSAAQQVAESAVDFALLPDDDGRLHLVYARALESEPFPAGIYYRQRAAQSGAWSAGQLLLASRYARTAAASGSTLHLAHSGAATLLVLWENRALEQLVQVRSADNGSNWGAPTPVEQRTEGDNPDNTPLHNVRLLTVGNRLLLLWQGGHGDVTCALHGRVSADNGATWQPRVAPAAAAGCGEPLLAVPHGDGVTVLAGTNDGPALLAWDGATWSAPQPQPGLTDLRHPDTFRRLALGCLTAALQPAAPRPGALQPGAQLLLLGCSGERGAADIWVTGRSLAETPTWFVTPEPPLWQVTSAAVAPVTGATGLQLAAGDDGRLLALWLDDAGALTTARYDGGRWSRAGTALAEPATHVATAVTRDGRLLALLSDRTTGRVVFREAPLARATVGGDWTEPVPVGAEGSAGAALTVLPDGALLALLTVPLNEGRGVYATRSVDRGATWSAPVTVFDAAAAGWAQVGTPQLVSTPGGRVVAQWARLGTGGDGLGLVSAVSADGGATWQPATSVSESPVAWQRLLAVGDRTVHRLWQEGGSTRHALSLDGGATWSRPAPVGGAAVAAALTADPAGRPHLLLDNGSAVSHRLWADDRWTELPALDGVHAAAGAAGAPVGQLAAAVSGDGTLTVLLGGVGDTGVDEAGAAWTAAQRVLPLPADLPTPLPPLTPTATATPVVAPTATPTPLPTLVFPTDPGGDGLAPALLGSPSLGTLVLGALAALIVAGVAFLIAVRRS